jgi:hypothetical protein
MSKVPHLLAVEAWKVASGRLMWWPDGSLLCWWTRSMVELLLLRLELSLLVPWVIAPILLLLRLVQLTPRWGIHYVILRRSTARTTTTSGPRHHPLTFLLIGLSNCLHQPLLINGCTHQLVV